MPKTADQINPNYGPVYAASLYPKLAKIFQRHGYALAVHGSVARDFDLIAVPWAEAVSAPEEILQDVIDTYAFARADLPPEHKHHGRVAYLLIFAGEFKIDLSFFPNPMEQKP